MLCHVLRDDGTEAWEPLEAPAPLLGTSGPAIWQDVSSGVMFGFNGLRHWPDLGAGGGVYHGHLSVAVGFETGVLVHCFDNV